MTMPKPYTLKTDGRSSDDYYQAIAAFADAWLEKTLPALERPAANFSEVMREQDHWQHRSAAELCFEMLVLGILLRENGEQALQMAPAPAWLLARLVETQERLPLPAIEKPVKAARGLLYGLARIEQPSGASPDTLPFPGGAARLVERLVDWLQAQGLTAQAERIAEWRDYFRLLDEQAAQAVLARSLLLAEDFETESEAVLGAYTAHADAFAQHPESCARWRYDASLVRRARVEYHLGMLGTEILTRAYRERFRAMPRKIVIMPDCLCARSRRVSSAEEQGTCQAERTELGLKCSGCTPGCKVRAITRLGEQHGFEAYILPDDYRAVGLGACRRLEGVGVVGVSCALTNWDAGWQVTGAGVPAQGLLLDYAGCRSHWDDEGVTTDVNLKKLVKMIGEEANS